MPTIEIVWKETPSMGTTKQGEFKCGGKTYYVEVYSNKNITISNRCDLQKNVSLPWDLYNEVARGGGESIKINSPNWANIKDFVLYYTHQRRVTATDISETLKCDFSSGVALASQIMVA